MRLGLQTIRKSESSDATQTNQGSASPSKARSSSQEPRSSESKSGQSTGGEASHENKEASPEVSKDPNEETEPSGDAKDSPESDEQPSRSSASSEDELSSDEPGQEPVDSPSDRDTDGTSPAPEESGSRRTASKLLRKGTSFSGGQGEDQTQNFDQKSAGGKKPTAGEDFRRYRAVETTESSDTHSMSLVLADSGNGSREDTTSVNVPKLTVHREAPDRDAVGEESKESPPASPRPSSVDRDVIKQPLPEVPEWLEKTGQNVRVVLQYDINREGDVREVDVLGSSGYPDLDDRSIDRLGEWQYEPGTPVRNALTVFEFRLR